MIETGVPGTGMIGVGEIITGMMIGILHIDPENPVKQVHVHAVLPSFETTSPALPLQWVATVHWVHVGYAM